MLKRKASESLELWFKNKSRHALLITGARQVGKTYLTRAFAQEHYQRVVEFNLVDNRAVRESFKKAVDAGDLMLRMSTASPLALEPGKTVVFIDEVQECPEIVTFIKFLVDKGEYDYILSGSLLGIELENISSQPVGYITEVQMYPLDFEEFCWANGLTEETLAMARRAFISKRTVPDYLHERMLSLFHRYLLVGGMPDAVEAFIQTNSLDQVRVVQENILTYYRRDISKYASKDRRLVIKNIFDLIPSELSRQNKRFRLSSIENVNRFTQVAEEFLWLTKAGVALAAYNIKAPIAPLLLNENHSLFKLFQSDVGLLTSQFSKEVALGLLDGKPPKGMGGIYENFVAQELNSHGFTLRYFTNKKIGEVDFVVERRGGTLTALEVKSGVEYKVHAALNNALTVKEYEISEPYVFAETNTERA
ncbi:MAG: AAA family ATPase, partial [Coriobacteriales bacterium]|nr:AAA family ATPase [Coriobacteriales bacterium]